MDCIILSDKYEVNFELIECRVLFSVLHGVPCPVPCACMIVITEIVYKHT